MRISIQAPYQISALEDPPVSAVATKHRHPAVWMPAKLIQQGRVLETQLTLST